MHIAIARKPLYVVAWSSMSTLSFVSQMIAHISRISQVRRRQTPSHGGVKVFFDDGSYRSFDATLPAWREQNEAEWEAEYARRCTWTEEFRLPTSVADPQEILERCEAQLGSWPYPKMQLLRMWRRIRLGIPFKENADEVVCSEAQSRIVWPRGEILAFFGKTKHDYVAPVHVLYYCRQRGYPVRRRRNGDIVFDQWAHLMKL